MSGLADQMAVIPGKRSKLTEYSVSRKYPAAVFPDRPKIPRFCGSTGSLKSIINSLTQVRVSAGVSPL